MTENQKKYIIEKILERDGVPWKKPFCGIGFPQNWNSRRPYSGINLLLFSALNYPSPYFITSKKAFEEKIKLSAGKFVFAVTWIPKFYPRKGETSEEFSERKKNGNPNHYGLLFHALWNISETSLWESLKDEKIETQIIIEPQKIINETQLSFKLRESGSAFFNPLSGEIGMPLKEKFSSIDLYYAAFFHEMVHATKLILNRKIEEKMVHGENYAAEELVAEIGSWMLCQHSGISTDDLSNNSASYISTWRSRIKSNPDILFWAMSEAEKAVSYILNKKEDK